jgi:DNA (cytosine-5)-methyltransferase 1
MQTKTKRIIPDFLPTLIYLDFFCGAGGVTAAVEAAKIRGMQIAKVIAAINHDELAIASHARNHKKVLHFREDIRKLAVTDLVRQIEYYRKKYPNALLVLWFSAECTHFSKAAGGVSRDADSRTLPEHCIRYIEALKPDYALFENVVEFRSWGDLDDEGKPISKDKGKLFVKWQKQICKLGYRYEDRDINSANMGAWTRRVRYFGMFAKGDLPIAWPEPTHCKEGTSDLFTDLKKWKPVREVLNFKEEGRSIFQRLFPKTKKSAINYLTAQPKTRPKSSKKAKKEGAKPSKPKEKIIAVFPSTMARPEFGMAPKLVLRATSIEAAKTEVLLQAIDEFCKQLGLTESDLSFYRYHPLSEKSLARVNEGLIKYVAGGKKEHQARCEGLDLTGLNDSPAPLSKNDEVSMWPAFISQRNGGNPSSKVSDVHSPSRTLTQTGGNLELVKVAFIPKWLSNNKHTGANAGASIDEPSPTVTTQNRLGLAQVSFLANYYSSGGETSSVDSPSPTLTTKDRVSIVQAHWLDKNYSGPANHQDINSPAGALCTKDHYALVSADHFIDRNFSGGGQNASVDEPCGSLLTVPKVNLVRVEKAFLMNNNYNNVGSALDQPSPAILASRRHHYLVKPQFNSNHHIIYIYPDDSENMVKIKTFMAIYGIIDIKMRMLMVSELKRIMGFPKNYYLAGNQSDQKKFIGNSVEHNTVKAMTVALVKAVREWAVTRGGMRRMAA